MQKEILNTTISQYTEMNSEFRTLKPILLKQGYTDQV